MKTFCIKTFHRLCIQGRGRRSIPPMAVLLEPAGKVEQYSGTLLYESSKAIYRQRHSRVLNFHGSYHRKTAVFSTGANHSYNWRLPEAVSTHAHFCVSGEEKPVRTLSIESIRERLQIIHSHGIKKRTRPRPDL